MDFHRMVAIKSVFFFFDIYGKKNVNNLEISFQNTFLSKTFYLQYNLERQ